MRMVENAPPNDWSAPDKGRRVDVTQPPSYFTFQSSRFCIIFWGNLVRCWECEESASTIIHHPCQAVTVTNLVLYLLLPRCKSWWSTQGMEKHVKNAGKSQRPWPRNRKRKRRKFNRRWIQNLTRSSIIPDTEDAKKSDIWRAQNRYCIMNHWARRPGSAHLSLPSTTRVWLAVSSSLQSVFLFRDLNLSRRGSTSRTFRWALKRREMTYDSTTIPLTTTKGFFQFFLYVGQRCAKRLIEENIHLCIAGVAEEPAFAPFWEEEGDKAIELGQASGGTT